jgi:hypothetical protein
MKKIFIILLLFNTSLLTQFKPFDWYKLSLNNNNNTYTPVTKIDTSVYPLSAYTDGWMKFNGTNQFMRSRPIEMLNFIKKSKFQISISLTFGLPRKQMLICGKFNGTNSGFLLEFNNTLANGFGIVLNSTFYPIDTVDASDSTIWHTYTINYDSTTHTLKTYEEGVLKSTISSYTFTGADNSTRPLVVGHGVATTAYGDPTDGQLTPYHFRGKIKYLAFRSATNTTYDSACVYRFVMCSQQMAYDSVTYLDIDATTPDGFRPGSHLCNGVNPGTDSCDASWSLGYRKNLTNVTALGYGMNKWSNPSQWYINSFTNGQDTFAIHYDVFSGEVNRYNVTPGVWTNNTDTSEGLAAWNNQTGAWTNLGSRQFFTGTVTQVKSLNGVLYAGGPFSNAGGLANADYVAQYNGVKWDSVGRGFNNSVNCFGITPEGRLLAGGFFDSSGTTRILSSVAEWNGTSWSAVGTNDISTVWALEYYGNNLYAATQNSLYYLNGTTWTQVSGTSGFAIYTLQSYKGDLWMGGIDILAKYNPATGIDTMGRMEGFAKDAIQFTVIENDLYLVGSFYRIIYGGIGVVGNKVARWNGREWSAVNYGLDLRPEDGKHRIKTSQNYLVTSGDFYTADGIYTQNAAHINVSMSLVDTTYPEITHTALSDTMEANFPLTVSCSVVKANGTAIDSVYLSWKKGVNGTATVVTLTDNTLGNYSGYIAPDTSTTIFGDTIFYSISAVDLNSRLTVTDEYSFIILSNPTDYRTGLIYQFWADSNTTANTSVTTWKNTIDTLTARQNTAGDKPVHVSNQINGHGVVRFTTSDYLNLPTITLTNFTITFAFKSRDNTDNYLLATSGQGLFNSLSALNYGIGGFDGARLRAANRTGLDTNWHIATVTNTKVFVDGVEKTYAATQNLTGIVFTVMGGRVDVSMFFKGDIACIRIFNSQLSNTNRQLNENAINSKLLIY